MNEDMDNMHIRSSSVDYNPVLDDELDRMEICYQDLVQGDD